CRYLQLDEVNLTYLCDPELRAQVTARGDDPAKLPAIYADMINAAISDIPSDMTITMHLCRGNFRSTFVAAGGYEPVAEILFNTIKVDGYFMEYDTERAGGFEPLRLVPKDKTVVLGLVTTKTGRLESRDELRRRIEAAAKLVEGIRKAGGEATASTLSIAEPKNADKIVKTALDAFGRVDILVNNAGILRDVIFHKMSWSDWSDVLAVHLNGSFNMSRA